MRILLLFHRHDPPHRITRYYATALARHWENDGHEVIHQFGPTRDTVADVCFVHVNLSVVPGEYLDFARRHPIAVNGSVADIRKSTISNHVVDPGDAFAGPVIVKSNLNFAGRPEQDLRPRRLPLRLSKRWRRLQTRLATASLPQAQSDYHVYTRVSDVPAACFSDKRLVVEKFLPERDGEYYAMHSYYFLGDSTTCNRFWGVNPIVTADNAIDSEREEPPAAIVELRRQLGFDYGKFDFVMHNGAPVLIDANKTIGFSPSDDPEKLHRQGVMARGLYSLIDAG